MKYAIAVLAFAATALAGDYPTYPETTTPVYPVYPVKSEPAKTYPATYPVSTYEAKSTPVYPVYPAKSSPVYPVYPAKNETVTYATVVYPEYTTVCPEATHVTYGGSVYTVTKATTLVIPCTTITTPVWKPYSTPCTTSTWAPETYAASHETYAPYVKVPPPAQTSPCTTTMVYSKYPAGAASPSGSYATASPMPYKQANGASANQVGALVAGAVAGVVALVL